jgi:hypothetical protein
MPRIWTFTAIAAASALGLSACHLHHHVWTSAGGESWDSGHDTPVTVADQLTCPQSQGGLERTAATPDGQSCTYQRSNGERVTLLRLPLNGQTPRSALAPIETALSGEVTAKPGAAVVAVNAADGGNGDDKAKIDLPGVHIDANGDKAKVSVFGVTVNADGDKADVHAGSGPDSTTVHAGPGGAEIRAGSVGNHAVNLFYILAGDQPGPNGFHAVGYLARGPVAGPLVVGEFKSKADSQNHSDHDFEALIDMNLHSQG